MDSTTRFTCKLAVVGRRFRHAQHMNVFSFGGIERFYNILEGFYNYSMPIILIGPL